MSASAMVHSYAQEWEAATDCAETCQLWAASGLEKASVGLKNRSGQFIRDYLAYVLLI